MNSSSRSAAVPFIRKACGLDLREFQEEFLAELFREQDGKRAYTAALWGLPRGNGKTEVAAAVAVYMLVGDGRRNAEVIIAAGSRDQAAIAFQAARRMVQNNPVLDRHLHVLPGRKVIIHPASDSELKIVSREGPLQHGLKPSAVIFDEVWNQPDRDLWDALVGGLVKVPEPLLVCISTAGYDDTSLLADLCRRGEAGEDPRFLYRWHGLAQDSELDYRDPETWKLANPAMSCERPFLSEDGVRDSINRMHEAEARRWHLNQWTQSETTWLLPGTWGALEVGPAPRKGASVALGFSGNYEGDSAGLVGCHEGRVFVLGAWDTPEKQIPRVEVEGAVKRAMKTWRVTRLACNPPGWENEVDVWAEQYGDRKVVRFPVRLRTKWAESCGKFFTAVVTGSLSHDGSDVLYSQLARATPRDSGEAQYITGDRIDVAKAAVIAFDQGGIKVRRSAYAGHGMESV